MHLLGKRKVLFVNIKDDPECLERHGVIFLLIQKELLIEKVEIWNKYTIENRIETQLR